MFLKLALLLSCITCVVPTCHDSTGDCKVVYGPWSDCDPCTKLQSRHINVTTPAHHQGQPCPKEIEEHISCVPTIQCATDLPPIPCPGQFDCGNAKCIDNSLVCNGDDDCGNTHDERSCTVEQMTFTAAVQDCLSLKPIPYLDLIGSGVDIVSGNVMGRVFDNEKYQGLCRKAYDGDALGVYRLPYNVNNFHFQVTTSDDLSASNYDSMQSYSSELDKSDDTEISGSLGFTIDSFGFSASVSYSHTKTFQDIESSASKQQSVIYKLNSRVELAQFIMNEGDFSFDDFFLNRIKQLPVQYSAKPYFDLFQQYGTHYLHSGVLGGLYEHNYVFSSSSITANSHTTDTVQQCLKTSMKASIFTFSASEDSSVCSSTTQTNIKASDVESSASSKVVNIKGGTAAVAGKLAMSDITGGASENVSKYEAWVNSLTSNPALLSKEVRSICELIYFSNTPNGTDKYNACITATTTYLAAYSTANCQACKNGGAVLNINQVCSCACTAGFGGATCDYVYPADPNNAQNAQGPTPLRSFAVVPPNDLQSQPDNSPIKFITTVPVSTGNPIAQDPPALISVQVGSNDEVIKSRDSYIYLLSSVTGMYANTNGITRGGYSIKQYDEYLRVVSETAVDFSQINCLNAICNIYDFDVDYMGNYFLSLQAFNLTTKVYRTTVYWITNGGAVLGSIVAPCSDTDNNGTTRSYLSLTCDSRVVITCPGTPATLRIFSIEGLPQQVIQLKGLDELNSVQIFNGNAWVHTKSRQVLAYGIDSWQVAFNYSNAVTQGDPLLYTQLFVDFAGNVIAGQSHNIDSAFGRTNEKFVVLDGTQSQKVLVSGLLNEWNMCQSMVALNGKMYTRCAGATDDSQAKIFAFDYLK